MSESEDFLECNYSGPRRPHHATEQEIESALAKEQVVRKWNVFMGSCCGCNIVFYSEEYPDIPNADTLTYNRCNARHKTEQKRWRKEEKGTAENKVRKENPTTLEEFVDPHSASGIFKLFCWSVNFEEEEEEEEEDSDNKTKTPVIAKKNVEALY